MSLVATTSRMQISRLQRHAALHAADTHHPHEPAPPLALSSRKTNTTSCLRRQIQRSSDAQPTPTLLPQPRRCAGDHPPRLRRESPPPPLAPSPPPPREPDSPRSS